MRRKVSNYLPPPQTPQNGEALASPLDHNFSRIVTIDPKYKEVLGKEEEGAESGKWERKEVVLVFTRTESGNEIKMHRQ